MAPPRPRRWSVRRWPRAPRAGPRRPILRRRARCRASSPRSSRPRLSRLRPSPLRRRPPRPTRTKLSA
ncbi:hypothetical protein C6569_17555 [Phreatobacter cathodiphilus]|uniref:Uncharacterized protein n=1 Tax=Phreatobacter cathodiphilus TaxID=1868589 RepID=A0A2S0NIA5_9HYPH|nr:hypothetical protein C6569_17555 [Phreatobacter cathodiphilus]